MKQTRCIVDHITPYNTIYRHTKHQENTWDNGSPLQDCWVRGVTGRGEKCFLNTKSKHHTFHVPIGFKDPDDEENDDAETSEEENEYQSYGDDCFANNAYEEEYYSNDDNEGKGGKGKGKAKMRPRGRPPKGKSWDDKRGEWVEIRQGGTKKKKDEIKRKRPTKKKMNEGAAGGGGSSGVGDETRHDTSAKKRPRGRTPKGKIWVEGCGYVNDPNHHTSTPAKKRPRGRPPKGKKWDEEKGVWVDEA